MIIKFKQDVELEVVTGAMDDYIESDYIESENETFRAGSQTEIDKISESEIQFGDGSVSFVTPEFWVAVEIVEN
jgi:hypothetical protein